MSCIGAAVMAFGFSPQALLAGDAATEQAKTLGQFVQKQAGKNKHPDAQWFPKAGLGLFIHWGIAAVQAKGDLSWVMLANKSWYDGTVKPNDYYASIKDWKPDHVDYDKMLAAAKAAGFKYAVLTTRHHDGFALWPSEYGDLGTKYTFQGRDFVKEFVTACRKNGLKVGLYYSPPDWWFDRQYRSWAFSGEHLDMDHKPAKIPEMPPEHRKKRDDYIHGQLTELLTNYGKIDLIWFDGGDGSQMFGAEVSKLQPGIVNNGRNGSPCDYNIGEGSLPSKRFTGWYESCVPSWPQRMWSYREPTEYSSYDAPMILTMLVTLRAWGGNLLANLGPKGDGSVPEAALKCWADMAKWMSHSSESIFGVSAGPWPEKINLPVTLRGNTAYVHFLPPLPEKMTGNPEGEKHFTLTKQIIPSLPARTNSAVWRDISAPVKVTLLRTGEDVPFEYDNRILTITPAASQRTMLVDAVKVMFSDDFSLTGNLQKLGAKVIACDSQDSDYPASLAIDGDQDTIWHTAWKNEAAPLPHFLVIDFGKSRVLKAVTCLSRQDSESHRVADCEVYMSADPAGFENPVATATLEDSGELQIIYFKKPVEGRYLKFLVKSTHSTIAKPLTAIAELGIKE